ncbi:hypothetical protein RHOSPDRAFT_34995 [Rhodotorula sp. JG-1b]|nr:hypothetical protein RHOSPDRAFT_34995 [Rhodotorula sp. JG-1b]
MKFTATIAAIASLASLVAAGGSIDNSAQASQIASSASTLSGGGNYILTNVATGQTLSFSRSDVTNFVPQSSGEPVAIQFNGNQARISGGNNKCASAQWDANYEGGVDYAAVAYACAVGSGPLTGTATLERTKQWWYFVPAGESSAPTPSPAPAPSSSSAAPAPAPSAESTPSSSSSSSSDGIYQFNEAEDQVKAAVAPTSADSTPAASSSASSSSDSKQATWNPAGFWESSSSTISLSGIDTSNVNSQDRTTWICRHPGWWLANHQDYVYKAGHVECAGDLKAYLASQQGQARMGKRSVAVAPSHKELAKKLAKRGQQSYYIIAVDHIQDMATRAIGADPRSTFGGYQSTALDLWDQGNNGQMWTITQA